jgi:hypothetical protein
MGSLERTLGCGLEVLLRGVREFLDSHDKPFLKATPYSGQAHTFKTPTTRLKERFSVTKE